MSQPANSQRSEGRGIDPRGRSARCPCCDRRLVVRGGQVWESRNHVAELLVIAADRDGAIVEQVGREGERWGISYRDLLRQYRLGGSGQERPLGESGA